MNFLDKLLQAKKGAQAQLNPFDGGKTFNSPQPRPAIPSRPQLQPKGLYESPAGNNDSWSPYDPEAIIPPQMPIQGQAQVPFTQETADRYEANPEQFSGKNAIDPKYFGYAADDTYIPKPRFTQQSNRFDYLQKLLGR